MDTTSPLQITHAQPAAGEPRHASLTLDGVGAIRDCDDASERLFGYAHDELTSLHVSALLPQLARVDLLPEGRLNPDLQFRCRIGTPFRVACRGGGEFKSRLTVYETGRAGEGTLRLIVYRA